MTGPAGAPCHDAQASGREAIVDIYSLAAANIYAPTRSAPMSAQAEDRYYSQHITLPRVGAGLLTSIAMTVGVALLLGMSLI
jgi:hypothetical protein